jgi:hypothetical protein
MMMMVMCVCGVDDGDDGDNDDDAYLNRLQREVLQNLSSICIYVNHTDALDRHEKKEIKMANIMSI